MQMKSGIKDYIHSVQPELRQLVRDMCAIPAPSGHEGNRAEFCRNWFARNGGTDVFVDEALNVICPWNVTADNDLMVFMAHTDTVFPDMDPLPFSEHDGRMFCPGVTDDTANLAVLMVCARYVLKHAVAGKTGILFVANSCEEGLGNLKGSRAVMDAYGSRIREFVTVDGSHLNAIVTEAVGSHRYRVTVRTEGGHSFAAFGNRNAIQALSAVIQDLYAVEVPVEGNSKTTYNVGQISGGTSVNTIAQQAEMLYEYRSDHLNCLKHMEEIFMGIIEAHRATGLDVQAERIGDRPCGGNVNREAHEALIARAEGFIRNELQMEPACRSGSTDANIALAEGIPAICISGCSGGGCHTREEWLDIASLEDGCSLLMEMLRLCPDE